MSIKRRAAIVGIAHGYNLILESVRQIRGTSTNQIPGCQTCLVTSGAGVPTSAFVVAA